MGSYLSLVSTLKAWLTKCDDFDFSLLLDRKMWQDMYLSFDLQLILLRLGIFLFKRDLRLRYNLTINCAQARTPSTGNVLPD